MARWTRLIWCTLIAAMLGPLSASNAQSADAPPTANEAGLFPGEYELQFGDTCRAIVYVGDPKDMAFNVARFRNAKWQGDCSSGLANGPPPADQTSETTSYPANATFLSGRMLSPYIETTDFLIDGISQRKTVKTYRLGSDTLMIHNLPNYAQPTWSDDRSHSVITLSPSGVVTSNVFTLKSTCSASVRESGMLPTRAFKGCVIGKSTFSVVTMEISRGSNPYIVTPCPDPYSAANCIGLWQKISADMVSRANALIARVDAYNVVLRSRAPALFAQWSMNDIRRKQQQVAAAKAAEEAANAERARQATALATQAHEDKLFQAGLRTMGAGQLFAKADELRRAGEVDKANQMLRSLIARFPNSPLVTVAAQQLAGSGGQTSAVAKSSQTAASPARSGRSCNSYINELTGPLNEGNAGIPMTGNSILNGTYQFYSLATQIPACRNTQDLANLRSDWEKVKARCRANGDSNCETGRDPRAASYQASTRQAFDRIVASASSGSNAASAGSPAAASGCAGTPSQELAAFNTDLNALRSARPMPDSEAGARATYRWMYAFSLTGLQKIEPRRVCLGQYYMPNRTALERSRDTAKAGCEAISSSGGACPTAFP